MPSSKNGCCFFAIHKKGNGGGTGGMAKTSLEEYRLNRKRDKIPILITGQADSRPGFRVVMEFSCQAVGVTQWMP